MSAAAIGSAPIPGGGLAALYRIIDGGLSDVYLDRLAMMRIPAVKRGRNVIAGTIAEFPFRTWRTDAVTGTVSAVPLPTVLQQPETWRPRVGTITWTVDDLIFYPHAWWRILDRDSTTRYPTQFERIEPNRVTYETQDSTGRPIKPRTYVDNQLVDDAQLVRFDAPDEGLLELGSKALATAYALENAANAYADTKLPQTVLTYGGDGTFTRDKAIEIRDAYEEARRTSTTAVLGANMSAAFPGGDPDAMQLIESRQYSALEVSRLLGLPARYVNATSGDSATYSNSVSERRDLRDLSLAPYIGAIEQRLSMGDVTPRGTTVRMDTDSYLRANPLERAQYWSTMVGAGIATPEQAAEAEGLTSTVSLPGDNRS